MYIGNYINRFEQFGKVQYDLVFVDDVAVMPDKRVTVNFASGTDTDELLLSVEQSWATIFTNDYNESIAEQV